MMLRWLALLSLFAFGAQAEMPSAEETRRLLRHGPWPPAAAADPSNRVSGNSAAIDLGARLFADPRLSANGRIACATCHVPERAFADRRKVAVGMAPVDRNSLALFDLAGLRWFGWDGANDSLWSQSLRPILDEREMGGSVPGLARLLRGDGDLACRYRRSFARSPDAVDEETLLVDAAKALAAYQETLVSGRNAFDAYRDALARGDGEAAARYPAAAARGAGLFVGRANCAFCHLGPRFANQEFHDTGLPFFIRPGVADPGRHGGIRKLQASPYTLLGRHNDDPARASGVATRHVALHHRNWGEFRVPGLRNVALTAPYMHNGSLATLRDVIRHYSELDPERLHADGEAILKPLFLSESEIDALVAFLESLTDPDAARAAIPAPTPCLPGG